MAIRHGIVASSVALPPTVTLNAATNFNQELATLNATVDANGSSTTVKFQYSTASNFSTYTEVNAATTPVTGQAVSSYVNITGLAVNTTYYFRCVVSNAAGTVTSSSLSFTTWSLKNYANGTSGTHYFSIPTVTPTGGSAVVPSIYNVFILGGGGGAQIYGAGGAGGGYRLVSSRAFSSTANTQLTLVVGGGGAAGNGTSGASGGTTQITASNFSSIDAGGGTGGDYNTGNGGNVGYGDNAGYTGGLYASYLDSTDPKNPILYAGFGGGAGINGGGGNGSAGSGYGYGGAGGTGGSAYGYNGGAGGGGAGTSSYGGAGAYYGYGSGGHANGSGSSGLIYFQYYGA
jgi:hypothetical protein